jgi:cell division protein FtsB
MRALGLVLGGLILLMQYPLWLGKGGWLRVATLEQQLRAQKEANAALAERNRILHAEVRDLKEGFEAIEERARYEFGMIKQDEIFYQIIPVSRP